MRLLLPAGVACLLALCACRSVSYVWVTDQDRIRTDAAMHPDGSDGLAISRVLRRDGTVTEFVRHAGCLTEDTLSVLGVVGSFGPVSIPLDSVLAVQFVYVTHDVGPVLLWCAAGAAMILVAGRLFVPPAKY